MGQKPVLLLLLLLHLLLLDPTVRCVDNLGYNPLQMVPYVCMSDGLPVTPSCLSMGVVNVHMPHFSWLFGRSVLKGREVTLPFSYRSKIFLCHASSYNFHTLCQA